MGELLHLMEHGNGPRHVHGYKGAQVMVTVKVIKVIEANHDQSQRG